MTAEPFHNDREGHTYRSLMYEIKRRTEAIDRILQGGMDSFLPKFREEVCWLQLRMICELIAFACLAVHWSVGPKADLLKTHKADWIMGELAKLHPKFFPIGIQEDPGNKWSDKTTGVLTKNDVQTLWAKECGRRLHRGSVQKVMTNAQGVDFDKIRGWRDKIVNLLDYHYIISADENFVLELAMEDGTGLVQSRTRQRRPPDEPPSDK